MSMKNAVEIAAQCVLSPKSRPYPKMLTSTPPHRAPNFSGTYDF